MTEETSKFAGQASRGDPGCLETCVQSRVYMLLSFKTTFTEASGIVFDQVSWHLAR